MAARRAPDRSATSRPVADAIGVDTGGTFTDVVAWRAGRRVAFKVPSTPRDPARAVAEALERAEAGRGTRVRHGSTVATNALLERKGARVAFVTTEGFEDLLAIGRQDRPDLYALRPRRTPPLVPSERRIGVRERVTAGGRVCCVTSFGTSVHEAVERSRAVIRELSFEGMYYRSDIGFEFE